MAIIKHDDRHASVYLVLEAIPIEQTVQLQYHVFTQPKMSYAVLRRRNMLMNVIGFRWGENAANLTGKLLAAIYIADPTAKEQLVKSVSIKDNRAYIDNEPLPYMFPDLEAKP